MTAPGGGSGSAMEPNPGWCLRTLRGSHGTAMGQLRSPTQGWCLGTLRGRGVGPNPGVGPGAAARQTWDNCGAKAKGGAWGQREADLGLLGGLAQGRGLGLPGAALGLNLREEPGAGVGPNPGLLWDGFGARSGAAVGLNPRVGSGGRLGTAGGCFRAASGLLWGGFRAQPRSRAWGGCGA